VGVAAIAITLTKLRETRNPNASRIDWAGLVTFSSSLFLLVLGLLRGNDEGWGSTLIVSLLGGAAVLMAAFLVIQTRVKEPMLPLHLFKKRAFTGVQLAALGVSASMFALFLYMTFYLQGFLGHDPIEAGIRYLPFTVTNFVVAAGTGALLSRIPARVIISIGLAITGLGLLLSSGIDPTDSWTTLLGGFLLSGAGVGLINPAMADVAVSVVPKEQAGLASGINDTFRQVGIAIGIAAWGAIFLGKGASKVETLAAGTPVAEGSRPRELVEAVSSGHLNDAVAAAPPGSRSGVADAAREGFLSGFNEIILLGGVFAILAAVVALWLIREEDIEREAPIEVEPVEPEMIGEPVPQLVAA
jgi:Major Facilitator Superfamily